MSFPRLHIFYNKFLSQLSPKIFANNQRIFSNNYSISCFYFLSKIFYLFQEFFNNLLFSNNFSILFKTIRKAFFNKMKQKVYQFCGKCIVFFVTFVSFFLEFSSLMKSISKKKQYRNTFAVFIRYLIILVRFDWF